MAYQQQYDNYQQPRQQPYYNQGPPPPQGRQGGGYDQQYNQPYDDYDGYGYDKAYEQRNDGYYDQQQGDYWGNGQQQRRYNDTNGQPRPPPQQGRPPPRDPHGQRPMYDDHQQPPPGRDPRGKPMGQGSGPPPNVQRGRGGSRPPGRERALMDHTPKAMPQDSAFPTFPSQASGRPKGGGSMDEAMALMNLGHGNEGQGQGQGQRRPMGPPGPSRGQSRPSPNRGPPPGRGGYGQPDMHRHDSGHAEGHGRGQRPPPNRMPSNQRPPPMNMESYQGPPQRPYNPASPTQQSFHPGMQRSMTMPQNVGGGDPRGFDNRQQWAESGTTSGYPGPGSRDQVPPRPSTAGGTRPNGYGRPQQFEQRPPMPQMPPQQAPPQQYQYAHRQPQDDGQADIDNLYDDYYGNSPDRKSKGSIDMPDFDAIPETNNRHRRGCSIENHLSPVSSGPPIQPMAPTADPVDSAAARRDNFYQQASKSRSQPDLHGQYSQGSSRLAMAGDVPIPPMPTTGPNGPRGRGPLQRGMTMDNPSRGPPPQGYAQGQPRNFDSRNRQPHPPVQRVYSDESAYSEPGLHGMRNGLPMATASPVPRPGTAAPAPGRTPSDPVGLRPGTSQSPTNPDALPAHPSPMRAGLMQQQRPQNGPGSGNQAARPPPVRQHQGSSGQGNQNMPKPAPERQVSASHPVTHDELNRLRNTFKSNPSDNATGLKLSKRLVEAASVLADEGGTADTRTRNKNREKFIMEAYKTVKKLVHNGSPDAMFYLADCYGQGQLGLQVDTKEAFTLYQSAAKAGHAASAYRTAVCCEMGHEEGGGTKKDPQKAVQWYQRAAALGDTPALYKMGMILLKGLLGQQKNMGQAINMLKRAAEQADEQNPHALHELSLIYEATTGSERAIRDEAYAFQLLCQASDLGYKFSQFRLGQAYEYGLLGCAIDARASLAWYTRAASQEEHQSELALSGWYLTGSQGILEQSDTEAYLWARKAACAEPPLPKALFAMGYFTEVGIGCPRSLEEAKRWYGRAAAYKFPKAQERLEELKKGGAKAQMKRERLSRSNQKQQEENCVIM